jgi:hypothetical protein
MLPYKMSEIQVGWRAALYVSINSKKRDTNAKISTARYYVQTDVLYISSVAVKDEFKTGEGESLGWVSNPPKYVIQ